MHCRGHDLVAALITLASILLFHQGSRVDGAVCVRRGWPRLTPPKASAALGWRSDAAPEGSGLDRAADPHRAAHIPQRRAVACRGAAHRTAYLRGDTRKPTTLHDATGDPALAWVKNAVTKGRQILNTGNFSQSRRRLPGVSQTAPGHSCRIYAFPGEFCSISAMAIFGPGLAMSRVAPFTQHTDRNVIKL